MSPADEGPLLLKHVDDVELTSRDVVKNMREKTFKSQGRLDSLRGILRSRAELKADLGVLGDLEPWSKAYLERHVS